MKVMRLYNIDVSTCMACCSVQKSREFGAGYLFCGSCHSVYSARSFSDEDLQSHYFHYYRAEHTILSPATLIRYEDIIEFLNNYRSKLNSILEIGCGSGDLLKECQSKGWKVTGTEISNSARKILKEKGIKIVDLDLASESFTEQFDVILLLEVLEHVTHPQELLEFCFKSLRPGGILFGTTPNAHSLNSRILGVHWSIYGLPEHLCIFTPTALKKIGGKLGFSKVGIATRGFNPFDLMQKFMSSRRFNAKSIILQSRVELGIALNEKTLHSKVFYKIKVILNKVFRIWCVGDSIEFKLVK